MIETIEFNDQLYPKFQSEGFAAQYIHPIAEKVCTGNGYDIGCGEKEWCLKGAVPIDPAIDERYDARNLPEGRVDFIFSSHCLEHLEDWVGVLDYWTMRINPTGTLFLYLPHYDQEYWRPWNNRKHIHVLTPIIIADFLISRNYQHIFMSGRDLNNSFAVMATR